MVDEALSETGVGAPQPAAIVADFGRRRTTGSFGKTPPEEWRAAYSEWDAAKKIAFLINALDEVDARQQSRPGYGDLLGDRRIAAIIGGPTASCHSRRA